MGAEVSRRWVLGALAAPLAAEAKAKVVIARDAKLRAGGAGVEPASLARLLDNAARGYCNVDTPVKAWRRVAKPGEAHRGLGSAERGSGERGLAPLEES